MRTLSVAVCLFLFALAAFAQGDFGAITGAVSDPDHAVVPGAPIQAKNAQTGTVYKATSSATGNYTLAELPAGTYELSVAVPGLRAYRRPDIVLKPGQTLRIDVQMEDRNLGTLGQDRAVFARLDSPHPTPSGPTPRTPDGKPDFSGVWYAPRNVNQEQPPMLPWAAALSKQWAENNNKDAPRARCLPDVVTLLGRFEVSKIVQTPLLLVIIHESDIPGYRQVFLDGRGHPKDMDATWTGHSIGKWEKDTLVVDTAGFNDKAWVTVAGNPFPHSEMLHITSRFGRPDLGHLEIEVTFDDPGAYSKPWKLKQVSDLAASEEVQEYICNENNVDVEHMVGK